MAKYLDKWKDLFPDTVGGTTRPSEAVSDQEEFNTNGFPQFIAQDPVNYALQNAFLKQFLSNDAWLWVKQQQANQALDKHKDDAQAHPNGISGNAASATKLRTPRALNLSGAVTADAATFDGTADATINVKTLDATKLKGTAPVSTTGNAATASKLATPRTLSLTGKATGSTTFDGASNASINVTNVNADTASKLSTARKINITGNATGSGTFDGSADANISVTVNESKHAAAADTLKSSPATETSTVARPVWLSWEGDNTKQTVSPNLTYTCSTKTLAAANFKGHLAGNADTATKATSDANGNELANAQRYMHVYDLPDKTNFDNVKTTGIYTCTQDNYTNKPVVSWGVLRVYWFNNNVKQEYVPDNRNEVWERYFTGGEWNAWSKVNAANADTAAACSGNSATATKLATPRTISLTGNASGSASFDGSGNVSINTTVNNATNADTVDGVHAGSMFYNKGNWADDNWATMGAYQVNSVSITGGAYGWGQVISSSTYDARFQLYAAHQYDGDGRLHYRTGWDSNKQDWNTILDSENYNRFAPTKTGSGASGTWGINISGTATNADKLDGYHARDLLGTLGGNRTPVITDIFDRAGTIDMSTMSAADKATHKANINKASNATQNIWRSDVGIYAYGGDLDIAGYHRGALKLTQSYKNFDKILVFGTNDDGNEVIPRLYDVWKLTYLFSHSYRFLLFNDTEASWELYGSVRTGTDTNYSLSTDTIWNTQDQNAGIIAIYGIKY